MGQRVVFGQKCSHAFTPEVFAQRMFGPEPFGLKPELRAFAPLDPLKLDVDAWTGLAEFSEYVDFWIVT